MARTRPIRISSPGELPARKIVIGLDDGDTFDTVSATTVMSGITLANVGPTTESIELNGETIAIGRAVELDVIAAPGLEDAEGYITIHAETTNGVDLYFKKRLTVYADGIPLDTEDQ